MLCLSLVTKKHTISQGCAVARNRCTYYFELSQDRHDGIDTWGKGIYSSEGYMGAYIIGWQSRLAKLSDRVWRQGPQGGVKIVKSRGHIFDYGYVTTNEERMKEFIWVKLKAQPVK